MYHIAAVPYTRSMLKILLVTMCFFCRPRDLNLHSMGMLFLNTGGRWIFDLCVFLHFLAILTSYVLAGSEAWAGVLTSFLERRESREIKFLDVWLDFTFKTFFLGISIFYRCLELTLAVARAMLQVQTRTTCDSLSLHLALALLCVYYLDSVCSLRLFP